MLPRVEQRRWFQARPFPNLSNKDYTSLYNDPTSDKQSYLSVKHVSVELFFAKFGGDFPVRDVLNPGLCRLE